MISLIANDWYQAWVGINKLFVDDPDSTVDERHSTRAFSYDNEIIIRNNDLNGLSLGLVGYTPYKLSLFRYNYINDHEIEWVKEMITERHIQNRKTYTLVTYMFEQKRANHSMGSCVINILVSVRQRGNKINIDFEPNMRIGESAKRLLVDFIFCQEIIQEVLDLFDDSYDVSYNIKYRSKALYCQPLYVVILEPILGLDFNKDHWLHKAVRAQVEKFHKGESKFKSGNRIRKYYMRLHDEKNK